MSESNKFFSKELLEISKETDPIVSLHLNKLNNLSNDIKEVENRLKAAAISFEFIYFLFLENRREKLLGEGDNFDQVDFYVGEMHCLVWGKNSENDYRLFYKIYRTENKIENCPYEGQEHLEGILKGESVLKFSKPLIEMPNHIRLNIENELPIFYGRIIDCLKSKKWDQIIERSPNYKIIQK